MCDLFASSTETTFSLTRPSLVRVVAHEPVGVDVDIKLSQSGQTIAESTSPEGAEGILAELAAGEYSITLSYLNSVIKETEHRFCETALLQIAVVPMSYVQEMEQFYQLQSCESSAGLIS